MGVLYHTLKANSKKCLLNGSEENLGSGSLERPKSLARSFGAKQRRSDGLGSRSYRKKAKSEIGRFSQENLKTYEGLVGSQTYCLYQQDCCTYSGTLPNEMDEASFHDDQAKYDGTLASRQKVHGTKRHDQGAYEGLLDATVLGT